MRELTEFVVGQNYSNDEIRLSLSVGNLGGIRPAVDGQGNLRHIAIITSTESARESAYSNPYRDRIESDVLIFTGSGRAGNQGLGGANKRLIEQFETAVPIFGFINHGRQSYEFLGLLELLRHYAEQQVDRSKQLRSVWMFEFRIHKTPAVVPLAMAWELSASVVAGNSGSNVAEEREVVATDAMQSAVEALRTEDLRARLLAVDPYKFESLIKTLVERYDFNDVQVTKKSGDGGIDITATVAESQSFFGGTYVQMQVKRWRHAVGSIEINNFRGAMSSMAKGIFVTTSHYTRAAIENAYHPHKSCVTLIDGPRLAKLIVQSGMAVGD